MRGQGPLRLNLLQFRSNAPSAEAKGAAAIMVNAWKINVNVKRIFMEPLVSTRNLAMGLDVSDSLNWTM